MMALAGQLRGWFGARSRTPSSSSIASESGIDAEEPGPDLVELAAGLEDGAGCPPALLSALASLIALRRVQAGVDDGPPSPLLSDLRVRRKGVPDGWEAGRNLLLAAPDATLPDLRTDSDHGPASRAVVVAGARSRFDHINLGGAGALVALGDGVLSRATSVTCYGRSTVLVGEGMTCTNRGLVESRNGGMVLIGADGMWAHGVTVTTDDAHAIRDAATGERLNTFGGRIVIGRHVWLCEEARVLGGARIGADAVIGGSALVKRPIAANSVAVGVPARVVRSGITWSRIDDP